jgi:hypothetical protein
MLAKHGVYNIPADDGPEARLLPVAKFCYFRGWAPAGDLPRVPTSTARSGTRFPIGTRRRPNRPAATSRATCSSSSSARRCSSGVFFGWIEIRLIVLPVFALVLKGIDFRPHLGEGGVIVFLTWFMILMSVNLLTSSFTRHSASRSPRKVGFSQTLTEPVSSIWNGRDIWSH